MPYKFSLPRHILRFLIVVKGICWHVTFSRAKFIVCSFVRRPQLNSNDISPYYTEPSEIKLQRNDLRIVPFQDNMNHEIS